MTVKIEIVSTYDEYRWSPSIVDVFSCCSYKVFCIFIFFHISLLLIFYNLILLLAKFFSFYADLRVFTFLLYISILQKC